MIRCSCNAIACSAQPGKCDVEAFYTQYAQGLPSPPAMPPTQAEITAAKRAFIKARYTCTAKCTNRHRCQRFLLDEVEKLMHGGKCDGAIPAQIAAPVPAA